MREKDLIDNPEILISGYNYSAIRDRLRKQEIKVSINNVIGRAKKLGCHKPRKKKKVHDREVITESVGALVQHDGSTHRWSPFSEKKWTLITSINDYSRLILCADFFSGEIAWPIFRRQRLSLRPAAYPCATILTLCEYSGLCRAETVSGANMSWRLMMSILSGAR